MRKEGRQGNKERQDGQKGKMRGEVGHKNKKGIKERKKWQGKKETGKEEF